MLDVVVPGNGMNKGIRCGTATGAKAETAPRNCKQRADANTSTGVRGPGKAGKGDDPRVRRPATDIARPMADRAG